MTARSEQETTVTFMRDDPHVYIYTSSAPDLRRFRQLVSTRDYVTEVRGGDDWGEFRVNAENFKVFSAIRGKRERSEAQRAAAVAAGDRLRARHALAAQGEGR